MNEKAFLVLSLVYGIHGYSLYNQQQLPEYAQCRNYGAQMCMIGYKCFERDDYYAQCLRSCPIGWKCNRNYYGYERQQQQGSYRNWQQYMNQDYQRQEPYFDYLLPEYARCSQNDACSNGLQCYSRDAYYGQCLSKCPKDWECSSHTSKFAHNSFSSHCDFKFGQLWSNTRTEYSNMDYIAFWAANFQTNFYAEMLQASVQLRKTPMIYAYFFGSMAKEQQNQQKPLEFIQARKQEVIQKYRQFANETARILGHQSESVWLIEPNFWHFYGEHAGLSGDLMRQLYDDIAQAIRCELANAKIAWNVPSDLSNDAAFSQYWSFFQTSQFIDFLFTSDGQARASSEYVHAGSSLRLNFMYNLTKKRIIVDTNELNDWNNADLINERIRDGLISVTQLNSRQEWNYFAKNVRPFLNKSC